MNSLSIPNQIQTIAIRSHAQRNLHLDLHHEQRGHWLTGYSTSPFPDEWPGEIPFSQTPVGDARALLKQTLSHFSAFLQQNADRIVRLDNPCHDPFVSAPEQTRVLEELGIDAEVRLNGQPLMRWW